MINIIRVLPILMAPFAAAQVPDEWDWRRNGVFSRVLDQGFQGNGAVFAAIAAIEQNYKVKYG
jgi:hypothetical protein